MATEIAAGGPAGGHPERPVPASTYRLQLHSEFSFTDAAATVGYLSRLGVTHVYCSPIMTATPGSTHGYDVTDHSHVNPELGGEAGLRRLASACHAAGMGLVVDLVPNHMSVAAPESTNAAWWSVLELGPASPYAHWFDIDWRSPDNPGRLLLPVLGDSLAECLKAGDVRLVEDDGSGPPGLARVRYFDHEAPVAPGTLVRGDVLATLDAQHYRLCHWRVAAEELPYRRFFDISTLAGLRQEDPAVFAATHKLIADVVAAGTVDGLRIDHPDGLADPEGYFRELRRLTGGVWTVAEKILEPGESLPRSWAVDGTTGYDTLDRVTRLFVDPAGADPLTATYADVARAQADYGEVVRAAKDHVLTRVLRPEVDRLAALALTAARETRADLTRSGLREGLCAVLAEFDVYRAYVTPGRTADMDARSRIVGACSRARARLTARGAEIDLLEELALSGPAEFVVRFQQTCGPAMAKAVEDTAYYRYGRLLALNEVGGDPGEFPGAYPHDPVEQFHIAQAAVQRDWPLTMTTLTTHDTKRSEDVRARLAVLSEDPRAWADVASRLLTIGARHADGENDWPDRPTLYFFLQTLVGAWPLPVERALPYMLKAVREAKTHTSWTEPNAAYEAALTNYIESVLDDPAFVDVAATYVATIAELGRHTALAQKLIQLTCPGIPDVYQGQELWDGSLVDPDNRRPVHFAERSRLLADLDAGGGPGSSGAGGRAPAVEDTGAAKLLVVSRTLRLRRERPEWFGAGASYRGLWASGSAAEHVTAFARSEAVITVVPRLVLGLRRSGGWRDTTLTLPDGRWTDALTGRGHDGGTAYVLRLLRDFPVTLLHRAD
ncbi:MAG: malto-oligosyltrehalose synthase [Frankia sp.]